jgi:transcriptional regulator with XRE-family HTH domain
MDSPNAIREFLISRRARLPPEQAGLPDFGGRRRVAALRREEVALIAGISVEYYTRLERGNATGMSESVLDGVGRALQLNETNTPTSTTSPAQQARHRSGRLRATASR